MYQLPGTSTNFLGHPSTWNVWEDLFHTGSRAIISGLVAPSMQGILEPLPWRLLAHKRRCYELVKGLFVGYWLWLWLWLRLLWLLLLLLLLLLYLLHVFLLLLCLLFFVCSNLVSGIVSFCPWVSCSTLLDLGHQLHMNSISLLFVWDDFLLSTYLCKSPCNHPLGEYVFTFFLASKANPSSWLER